jgi:translation initiation factor IF-1
VNDEAKEALSRDGTHHTGIIEEVLPRGMFRVRLDDGRTVRAGLSAEARQVLVRLLSGCSVEVRLSPFDPNRGQITKQL